MRTLVMIGLLMAAGIAKAGQDGQDGNWWTSLNEGLKTFYVLGFIQSKNDARDMMCQFKMNIVMPKSKDLSAAQSTLLAMTPASAAMHQLGSTEQG